MRKQGDGYMIRSEESITLNNILPFPRITVTDPSHSFRMTFYRPVSFWTEVRMLYKNEGNPQHDTEWRIYYPRWRLTVFPHHDNRSFTFVQDDVLPSIIILSGSKNAVWENRETAMWYGAKNLLPWMTSYSLIQGSWSWPSERAAGVRSAIEYTRLS